MGTLGSNGAEDRSSWYNSTLQGRAAEGAPTRAPQPRPYSQKAGKGYLGQELDVKWADCPYSPHEPRFVITAPTGWQWNGEPVQHSRLNSEHIPRPTHNIRNIIRQCQPTSRGPQPHRYPQALF